MFMLIRIALLSLFFLLQIGWRFIYNVYASGKSLVEGTLQAFAQAWGLKPYRSIVAQYMGMPSRGPYRLMDGGEMCGCLFMGDQAINTFLSIPHFPSPMLLPAQPLHSIQMTPDRGFGIFATRSLKASNLILAERPLLMGPSRHQGDLGGYYAGNSGKEWEDIMRLLFDRMSPKNQVAFAKLDSKTHEGYGPITRLMASNGFGLLLPEGDSNMQYICVFEQLSRVNHSCSPNAHLAFDYATFSAKLHALRDINKGEEITITYVEDLKSVAAKRKNILELYGFDCKCASCINPVSEDIRRCVIQSVRAMQASSTSLDAAIDDDSEEILRKSLKWISIIERERLQALREYETHLSAAAKAALRLGKQEDHAKYSAMAEAWLRVVLDGADGDNRRHLQQPLFRVHAA